MAVEVKVGESYYCSNNKCKVTVQEITPAPGTADRVIGANGRGDRIETYTGWLTERWDDRIARLKREKREAEDRQDRRLNLRGQADLIRSLLTAAGVPVKSVGADIYYSTDTGSVTFTFAGDQLDTLRSFLLSHPAVADERDPLADALGIARSDH